MPAHRAALKSTNRAADILPVLSTNGTALKDAVTTAIRAALTSTHETAHSQAVDKADLISVQTYIRADQQALQAAIESANTATLWSAHTATL